MSTGDLEFAQLLCTRLCHDLAGPIGAVAAGVELIGDDPQAADPETLSLIGSSSAAASFKLKFLRAILGTDNGAMNGGDVDLPGLLEGYLGATASGEARPKATWPPANALSVIAQTIGPKWRQTVLNFCLAALEMQPGCRELTIAVEPPANGAGTRLVMTATGNPSRILPPRADLEAALLGANGDGLNAKIVQAFLTGRMIRAAGGTVQVTKTPGALALAASF